MYLDLVSKLLSFYIFSLLLSCASQQESEKQSLEELSDFSDLTDTAKEVEKKEFAPDQQYLKDLQWAKEFKNQPNYKLRSTIGKVTARLHLDSADCLNEKGLTHISLLLDKAFLQIPDQLNLQRIGLDRGLFTANKPEFYIHSGKVPGNRIFGDRSAEFWTLDRNIEPIVFLRCSDVNSEKIPLIREFAKLYFFKTWSWSLRSGFARYLERQAPAASFEKPEPKYLELVGGFGFPRSLSHAEFEKTAELSMAFVKFLIMRDGIKKFLEIFDTSALPGIDPYKQVYDKNLPQLQKLWLDSIQ